MKKLFWEDPKAIRGYIPIQTYTNKYLWYMYIHLKINTNYFKYAFASVIYLKTAQVLKVYPVSSDGIPMYDNNSQLSLDFYPE